MKTDYPLLYTENWVRNFYVTIHSFMDVFCNGGEEITDEEEAFEFLYEWYMENVMGWIELPEEYTDEDNGNDRDAEVEAERIMMFMLPMISKNERGLKRITKRFLNQFHEKMESWLYDSEEEKKQWNKAFKKLYIIDPKLGWGKEVVVR
ncbi:MAG: hypothetical protein J6R59_01850 [Paludibacteraceae bacterium]|nr:hypothetical protein [Paludibacteraceae bacterium]